MNKISYPQLIKDVADTYRDATGSLEPVVVGELTSKLAEAMSSTGSNINIEYKSIVYNEDNTITLIDNEDVEHTVYCEYENDSIVAIRLDDEIINLGYNNDDLISVENIAIDLNQIPKAKTEGIMISGGLLKSTAMLSLNFNTILTIEKEE